MGGLRADAGLSVSAILLHPDDNVLVVTAGVQPGERLSVNGLALVATVALPVGHKVARIALAAGDKVVKYGAPIGSMTVPAQPGDHVHLHNMKSDYIASHTRDTLERSTIS
jgi:hypothetical protein